MKYPLAVKSMGGSGGRTVLGGWLKLDNRMSQGGPSMGGKKVCLIPLSSEHKGKGGERELNDDPLWGRSVMNTGNGK